MLALTLAAGAMQAALPNTAGFDTYVARDAEREPTKVVILCDPEKYRFSVRAGADAASVDRSYPRRTVVDPHELFVWLPGHTGDPEVRGPLIRYVRCGPYTIKLQGDAYNLYVQGQAGAYPGFAAVTVLRANRMVIGDVRLDECDRKMMRAESCPAGYAVRIDGRYDDRQKMLHLTETVSSTDDGDPATRIFDTRRHHFEDDLTLWRPDGGG